MKVCHSFILLLALVSCTVLCAELGKRKARDSEEGHEEQQPIEQDQTGQATFIRESSPRPKRREIQEDLPRLEEDKDMEEAAHKDTVEPTAQLPTEQEQADSATLTRDSPPRPNIEEVQESKEEEPSRIWLSPLERLLKECPDVDQIIGLTALDEDAILQVCKLCAMSKSQECRSSYWTTVKNGLDFILSNRDVFPDVATAIHRGDWTVIGAKDFLDEELALYTLERLQEHVSSCSQEGGYDNLLTVLAHLHHPPGRDYSAPHRAILELVRAAKRGEDKEFVTNLEKVVAGEPLLVWRAFRHLPGYEDLLLVGGDRIKGIQGKSTIREVLEAIKGLAAEDFVDDEGHKKILAKNIVSAFYRPHSSVHSKKKIAEYSAGELRTIIKNIHRKYQIELLIMGRVFDTILLSDEAIEPQNIRSKLRDYLATMPDGINETLKTGKFGGEYLQLVQFLEDEVTPIGAETLRGLVNALFEFSLGLDGDPTKDYYWQDLLVELVSHGVVGEILENQLSALFKAFYITEPNVGPLANVYRTKGYSPEQMRSILSVSGKVRRDHMRSVYLQPHIFDVLATTEAYTKDPKEALAMYRDALTKAIDTWESPDSLKKDVARLIELDKQYELDCKPYYAFVKSKTPLEVKAGDAEAPKQLAA